MARSRDGQSLRAGDGQRVDPPHWKRKPPQGIFPTGYSAPQENRYIDSDGLWIQRSGFGPYRIEMDESGTERFRRCLESVLRLYDFDLIQIERDGARLTIHARSK